LRRRCLYHFLDYPSEDQETRILMSRLPGMDAALAGQIAAFVALVRKEELKKAPGVAESLDWAASLMGLGVARLESRSEAILESLQCLLKTREDQGALGREVAERLLGRVA